jgi:hypothetical protein
MFLVFKVPADHIKGDIGTRMTDMGITIDGHPADIHLHLASLNRGKRIFFPRERIIDVYGHLLHATSLANGWKNIYFMGVLVVSHTIFHFN